MGTLVIETATAACSIALVDGQAVLAGDHEVVGRGHAERLVPMIRDCLGERAAPGGILVDCGPGSFTGVRVGLAAARALGLAWGVEVRGFSSLALLAAMSDAETVAVAITGGHGELFLQRFAAGLPLAPLASLRPEDAAAVVTEALVVGSGAARLVETRGWGEARDMLPHAAEARRLPAALAALSPSPVYGRAPDAKVPA